ncbi:hypothetical protein DFJ58DRAFT_213219, partial [Suillus subalutaceus]|uniref:uncharacterized protein n=1 Tax=Suillus subalutaceus TaxID=48586 RepID=UPI001B870761
MDGWVSGRSEKNVIAQSIMNHLLTLRSLKISRLSFSFDLADFDPFKNSRWPYLTHVGINVCQQNILLRLLQQAPNLSSAKISIDLVYTGQPSGPPLPVEPFTHTKLQVLHINCPRSLPPLPNLLNALSLPNLREFMASSAWMWWPHEEFKAFLARSKCPLEFLSFGDGNRAALDELRAEYIALIPSLEVVDQARGCFIFCKA